LIDQFTGISDPYEQPDDAEITIDTTYISAEQAAEQILEAAFRREGLEASVEAMA
jgi:sulfate adenylyltransferase